MTDGNQRGFTFFSSSGEGQPLEELYGYPLTHVDNDFVENHPKFAKRNDVTSYRRILGNVRFGLYNMNQLQFRETPDYEIDYGLAIVHGDYDNAGTWTLPTGGLPDPRETGDEDERWLFKNTAWLSFGSTVSAFFESESLAPIQTVTDSDGTRAFIGAPPWPLDISGTIQTQSQQTRPSMISTDQQLPNGSLIDIKTRRKARYGDKLYLIAYVSTIAGDTDSTSVFLNWNLRVLVNG